MRKKKRGLLYKGSLRKKEMFSVRKITRGRSRVSCVQRYGKKQEAYLLLKSSLRNKKHIFHSKIEEEKAYLLSERQLTVEEVCLKFKDTMGKKKCVSS